LTVSEICLGTMTFGSMADEETAVAEILTDALAAVDRLSKEIRHPME
jgi:aryl-alcohol dehydrogenase-like predicted oxidoreductase